MAPAAAADIGRNAADFVFLHESLSAVAAGGRRRPRGGRLVRQNFGWRFSTTRSHCPSPSRLRHAAGRRHRHVAVFGLVVANALRLRQGRAPKPHRQEKPYRPAEARQTVELPG